MADGLCSESDRKQFVAALINENGICASEKSAKCVNSKYQNRKQSAAGELDRAETVKRCVNREQQNMTATGQQQLQQPQQQQSKKVSDAKLSSKNKSATLMASAVGMAPGGAGTPAPKGAAGPAKLAAVGKGVAADGAAVGGGVSGGGAGGGVANTMIPGKLNNASRGGVSEIDKIGPLKVKSFAMQSINSVGAANGSKVQQKDLNSASAANVDMAGTGKSVVESSGLQDSEDSPSAKKKRCSDRYDSSESSDSGVATLSCTDSSTASSDASDPGSPYSPVSLGEDANQSSTKANMPPQILSITQPNHRVHHSHQSHHQTTSLHQTTTSTYQQAQKQQHQAPATVQHQWPWNVSSNNTISNLNTSNNSGNSNNNNLIVNANNKNSNCSSVNSGLSGNNNASAKNKRILSTNPSDINGTAKKVRTSAGSVERMHTQSGLTAAASKRLKAQQEDSQSQTKITGYFKSQMKPLKAPLKGDLSTLVARADNTDTQSGVTSTTGALDKYFNALAAKSSPTAVAIGTKNDKEQNSQRKPVAIKKDLLDVPPLAPSMPSLKKLERKPAKVAQVAPISRKTAVTQQLKSPKKHIAIAPRIMEASQVQKPQSTNAFQIDQTKISQPTVLLTAIRIPPQTGASSPQQMGPTGTIGPQSSTKAPPLTPTKMGSMLQIPVVPNLVQIPNILTTTNGTNLVMNNGQLARMGNGGQYFLNGTVLKLQHITNGHSSSTNGTTNGVLTMDSSALQGNVLVKPSSGISQTLPIVTSSAQPKAAALAIQQPLMTQASMNGNGCHQAFLTTTGQRIPTQSVLMATTSGWYVLNQSTTDPISNNIPHQTTLTTAMVCKSTRTAVTSMTNTVSPPVPPLVTLASKHEPIISSGPKPLTLSTPTTITSSIPAELKDKTLCSKIETYKPLSVECPPLEALPDVSIPVLAIDHKIESPKIATVSPKLPAPPTINTTIDIEDEEDSLIPASSTPKCAISPILSQPKTIRFPVPSGCEAGYRFGPKGTKRSDGVCYWDQCTEKYDTCSKLLDHLQTEHVNTQTGPFSCLWSGCKVRGRESCSRRWLERHVLSHGGTKPFKCIVDGCGLRLGSQLALQKHVNGHFNATESKDNPNKRTSDPPIPKLLRKNGKKARYRRQPFSARMFDFFDTGIMEGLQHRLMVTGSLANGSKGSVTFKGHSMARRKTLAGITELYVKWSPREIIPDEWVPESKDALTKTITIQSMRYQERFALQKYLGSTSCQSDISVKSVSKSNLFPSALSISSLFASGYSSSNNDADNLSAAASCDKKQSRKPPKRNKIEPS